ncbi:hypothetical protein J6590_004345 [Homalodisca vitripennis]|nr:hypothetical protein J6590_004345 [Homalodisca vitripennis]
MFKGLHNSMIFTTELPAYANPHAEPKKEKRPDRRDLRDSQVSGQRRHVGVIHLVTTYRFIPLPPFYPPPRPPPLLHYTATRGRLISPSTLEKIRLSSSLKLLSHCFRLPALNVLPASSSTFPYCSFINFSPGLLKPDCPLDTGLIGFAGMMKRRTFLYSFILVYKFQQTVKKNVLIIIPISRAESEADPAHTHDSFLNGPGNQGPPAAARPVTRVRYRCGAERQTCPGVNLLANHKRSRSVKLVLPGRRSAKSERSPPPRVNACFGFVQRESGVVRVARHLALTDRRPRPPPPTHTPQPPQIGAESLPIRPPLGAPCFNTPDNLSAATCWLVNNRPWLPTRETHNGGKSRKDSPSIYQKPFY